MRRSLRATAQRTVRRTVTWRPKQAGREPVDIAWLISPLRYDVLVRADFFRSVTRRSSGQSLAEFQDGAVCHDYFTWFREIEVRRFRPWLLEDPAALLADYRERVARAVQVHASFAARGYDPRFPVTLRSTGSPQKADSGLLVDRLVHVGDGGHRLALLLAADRPLEPTMYRVDPRPRPVIDNTAILLRHIDVDDAAYARFLSRGFLGESRDSLGALERDIAEQNPARLAEFREVVRVHRGIEAID